MALRIYNTLTGRKERFIPGEGNFVKMYVCGPTVYDEAHLGHARTYIAYDIITRYLTFKGFDVHFLMNITDVDDKIVERAKELREGPSALAERYTRAFFDDMNRLGVSSVSRFARASEHIPEIIKLISRLIERGYAYVVKGGVYFDTTKSSAYGRLSHQTLEEMSMRRIEANPEKRSQSDFTLWKKIHARNFVWPSPFGKGRPGWHIEDTAIIMTNFGGWCDIHGGAIELIYPHHDAEMAQVQALTGEEAFVKHWVHTGLLSIGGEKMSKSLGNFISIREVLKRYDPEAIRTFFALHHYRSKVNFREEGLKSAQKAFERFSEQYEKVQKFIKDAKDGKSDEDLQEIVHKARRAFHRAMEDDFDTPKAMAAFFSVVDAIDKVNAGVSRRSLMQVKDALVEMGSLIGLFG